LEFFRIKKKINKAHNGKNIEFVSTGGSVFINGEDFGNIKTQLDSHEEYVVRLSRDRLLFIMYI